MRSEILPISINDIDDSIYAGFWPRLGSLLLDFIILLPYIFILQMLNGLSISMFYITLLPSLLFSIWYYVYLVKKHGGTPGKLLVGIKIVSKNGADIDLKSAMMRQIVSIIISIIGSITMIIILQDADNEIYSNLGFWKRNVYIGQLNPSVLRINSWISNIWIYSELIVLLTNRRRRSIHDFIAKTVVIKAKYHDKIKELQMIDVNVSR